MQSQLIGVSRNRQIDDQKFDLVVETKHGSVTAITAVHKQNFGSHIGGVRFVTDGTQEEVAHLAMCMSKKCAAALIPADGQKSIIICPDGIPDSDDLKAEIIRAHSREVLSRDPCCIFGPDMKVTESVMDLLAGDSDLLNHVTGLSEESGGLSIDKNGHTALGIAHSIAVFCKSKGLTRPSITIQGFGAVGAHLGRLLHKGNMTVVGISTARGALFAQPSCGLPVDVLFEYWQRFDELAPEKYFASLENPSGLFFDPNPDRLFTVPTDIFVPAARTRILATAEELETVRTENSSVRDVSEFLADTGVRLIAEAANQPLTPLAEESLECCGVGVLPDYAINCGGLIACYIEWAL